jgi:hypothetical protein
MPSSYTPLLGFVQPSPGELTNTWGGVVNTQLTDLVEDAIASASTQSVTSGDWTLTTDGGGAANQARSAILIATGTPGTTRNIYAPKQDKVYVVINNSDSSVVLKGGPTSPTTGVTVVAAGISLIAWNSNSGDFVAAAAGVTSLTAGSGVSVSASTGAVTVANTGVTSAVAGTGIGVSGATGAVTFTNSGVTSIVAGTGITVSGATGAVTVNASAVSGVAAQTFTSSGTFTIPTSVTAIKMTIVGGGGASGGGGSGGGGGGAAIKFLTGLTPGNTLTVTVGAAGGTSSVASGTQSITTVSATGGAAGSSGGSGGIGSNGDLNIGGQSGMPEQTTTIPGCINITTSGGGGSSILGGGGTLGQAGRAYGGGGGGGGASAGAAGVVLIEW